MSIYVIQDKENSHDILQNVERACSKAILDRNDLGQKVWTSGKNSLRRIGWKLDDSLAIVFHIPP